MTGLSYRQHWRHWQGEEQLTAGGWPVSPVWMGEAGVEAVGGGKAGVEPQMAEGAGGEVEAWLLRCCEVGRA